MTQRVLKIILPPTGQELAIKLLAQQTDIVYWQEEHSSENFIVSVLTEAEKSETIMDCFEKHYSLTDGFKLIVLPVEASIPRTDKKTTNDADNPVKDSKKKNSLRISREELYTDIVDSTQFSKIYIVMVVLSTIVAAVGLQQNNVAVIIGAMVIAPFLGPNVGLALSACLADKKLGFDAIKTMTYGAIIVTLLAITFGYFFETSVAIPEIQSRTQVGIRDIFLALASGAAGVLAFTAGMSSTVIGVMVAVALLPPLTVFGLLLGAGDSYHAAGAFIYFFINIICINLAGVATFYLQGVTPRLWWEADKAKKATTIALLSWSILLCLLSVIIVIMHK